MAEKFRGAESTCLKYLNNASNRHKSFAIVLPYVKNVKLFLRGTFSVYSILWQKFQYRPALVRRYTSCVAHYGLLHELVQIN